MSKLNDQRMMDGQPARERYERFCGKVVETRNAQHAFRTSFVVPRGAVAEWVDEQARKLLADPEIAERVQALRDVAAAQLLIGVRDLMQDELDIINADPNEIISYVYENCRYCHGVDFGYQWVDIAEFLRELDRVSKANEGLGPKLQEALPTDAGGYGFDTTRDPNAICPRCFGQGIGRTVIHDTRKLSPAARKLYAGVKETSTGIEVKMHDKDKARERLGRMLGAFKDGVPVIPVVPQKNEDKAKPATLEDAGKAYADMINPRSNVVPIRKPG